MPYTLIKVQNLESALRDYPFRDKKYKLLAGFREGFFIGCKNKPLQSAIPKNHPPCIKHIKEARDLVNKEVKLKRILGPYKHVPIKTFIVHH